MILSCKTLYKLRVRSEPELNDSNIIAILPEGSTIEILSFKDCWINHKDGWSLYKDESGLLIDTDEEIIENILNSSINIPNKIEAVNEKFLEILISENNTVGLYNKINKFFDLYTPMVYISNDIDKAVTSGLTYEECVDKEYISDKITKEKYEELIYVSNNIMTILDVHYGLKFSFYEIVYNLKNYYNALKTNSDIISDVSKKINSSTQINPRNSRSVSSNTRSSTKPSSGTIYNSLNDIPNSVLLKLKNNTMSSGEYYLKVADDYFFDGGDGYTYYKYYDLLDIYKGTVNVQTSELKDLVYMATPSTPTVATKYIQSASSALNSALLGDSSELLSKIETTADTLSNYEEDAIGEVANDILFSYDENGNVVFMSTSEISQNITKITGLMGCPYQYDEVSDPVYQDGSRIGWKYYSTFITRSPLLYLSPVVPKFAPGFTKNERSNIFSAFFKGASDDLTSFLDNLGEDRGKMYSTKYALSDYYDVWTTLVRGLAIYLDIAYEEIAIGEGDNPIALHKFNASEFCSKEISTIWGGSDTIAFYVESIDSLSESHSNETAQSQLESYISEKSAGANEMLFYIQTLGSDKANTVVDMFNSAVSGIANAVGLLGETASNISEVVKAVSQGGSVIFPKIWSDSSFSFSGGNSFTVKLVAQNPCKLGWFLDIGIPLMGLIALTAPRSLDSNSYKSPFLVRPYCKSALSSDMAIISNLEIRKGDAAKWTVDDRLPTEVEVTIDIESMYSKFMTSDSLLGLINNTDCMDYLANLAGININKATLSRALNLYAIAVSNAVSIRNIAIRYGIKFEEFTNDMIYNLTQRFGI